jgi:hypothetical protein
MPAPKEQSPGEPSLRLRTVFFLGSAAGVIATLVQYFGGQALNIPFPPEEIFRIILYPVPGSIQSVAVDKLGEYAKYTAFAASTVGYILLYGFLTTLLTRLRLREKFSVFAVLILMTSLGLFFDLQLSQSYSLLSTTFGWVLSAFLLVLANVLYSGVYLVSVDSIRVRSLTPQEPPQQSVTPVVPRRPFRPCGAVS